MTLIKCKYCKCPNLEKRYIQGILTICEKQKEFVTPHSCGIYRARMKGKRI